MATREAIVQAIRNADARSEALRERIIAAPAAPLAEGEWRVRDALSHLAARANPLPLIEMVSAMAESGAEGPPPDDGAAMNAQQIANAPACPPPRSSMRCTPPTRRAWPASMPSTTRR